MSKLRKLYLPEGGKRAEQTAKARVNYGVSEWDVYDFDVYLINVIANGCRILQKTHKGVPTAIFVDYSFDIDTEEGQQRAADKWSEILDTIVVGFERGLQHAATYSLETCPEFDKAFKLFYEYFFSLWY